uniref:TLC domain containing 3B n=1 Tax=Kryptolebias marmoratus TaxID=37003 RepID=A0A3Q3GID3_KRYMA
MLALLAAGSVFFPGLFLVSKRTLKLLMGWSEADAVVLSTRLNKSVQWFVRHTGSYMIARLPQRFLLTSCFLLRHWLTEAYILFATPYFLYDIYAMFLCYRHKLLVKGHEEAGLVAVVSGYLRREVLMVLHHVFMVTFCFPASLLWRRGRGDYFQGVLFLAELSTPSVSLGKVLIQKQNSLLHRLNGGVVLVSFCCCRVLLFPYLYYAYSRYASIPVLAVPLVAPWQCNLGAVLLWPLQLYWFCLICRGALRQFRRHPNAPPDRTHH